MDDDRCAKIRKEMESASHPLGLAEGTSCTVQYRHLCGREVVVKLGSGGMVRENSLAGVG